jgi:uncharacterized Zn-binding protein involved in type VI secretion
MLPAARNEEQCFCPAHGIGAVNKSAAGSVETNGRGQARGGDSALCACGPVDFLVTGSGSVTVNSQPAARMSDKTMHRGLVMLGSGDVVIGGPTIGATLGNIAGSDAGCKALAAGRKGGKAQQSYGNCGIEVSRQMINRARAARGEAPITEKELLLFAIHNGQAFGPLDSPLQYKVGASTAVQRLALLKAHGVPASQQDVSKENVAQFVAEGRGVGVTVLANKYMPAWYPDKDSVHELLITGAEYDENGDIKSYILNDTGAGVCSLHVPAASFEKSWHPDGKLVVTDAPLR